MQVLEAHTSVIDDQSRQSSLSSFSLTQRNPVSIFSGTLLNSSLFTYHSTISFSTVLCATVKQAKLTTLASRLILDPLSRLILDLLSSTLPLQMRMIAVPSG